VALFLVQLAANTSKPLPPAPGELGLAVKAKLTCPICNLADMRMKHRPPSISVVPDSLLPVLCIRCRHTAVAAIKEHFFPRA
jgi:hypothetical protein